MSAIEIPRGSIYPWHRLPQDPKGHHWASGIATVETEEIRQLNNLPRFSEDSSALGPLKVKEQEVPISTTTVHCRQYRTDRVLHDLCP